MYDIIHNNNIFEMEDNNNIIGYIDINNTNIVYNILKEDIEKNFNKYYSYIASKPELYDIYMKIVRKRGKNQSGGTIDPIIPLVLLGLSSGLITSSSIAFLLYNIFTTRKCRNVYTIYPADKIPSSKEILLTMLPQNFSKLADLTPDDLFIQIDQYVETLYNIVLIVAPDSSIGKIGSKIIEFVAGIGLTTLNTVSAGTTVIISYLLKILNLIKDGIALLIKILKSLNDITKLIVDETSMRFLYDILNMNFKDGPFGIQCWVKYIIDTYAKDIKIYKKICALFDSLFDKIYNELINFLSKIITFSIPDGGISSAIFSSILLFLKSKSFDYLLSKMNDTYDKMSYDTQLLFENPNLMKKYLDEYIIGNKYYLDTINIKIYPILLENSYFFSFLINKLLAFVYAILNIFSNCYKI